jgi:NarL family two-component system response regulator LiaR
MGDRNGGPDGDDLAGDRLRVIVVDDDALARRAIRDRLQDDGLVVVAEAAGGREGIELTAHYQPDVVVMDLVMPGIDGLEATREITQRLPDVRVVVLTSAQSEELAMTTLRAGASGFVSKSVGLDGLVDAVRLAHEGEAVVTPRLTMRLIDELRRIREDGAGIRPVRSPLTSREWEILDLICQERSTDDIAYELVLSVETVRSHVKSILRKLGVRSQREAIRIVAGMRSELVYRRPSET